MESDAPAPTRVAIVGGGRVGTALSVALKAAGWVVDGPLGRGTVPSPLAGIVLLCVPDREIGAVAVALPPREGLLVGHCSGATPLQVLAPHEAFGLHPLMTITGPVLFDGATAAVAGTTPRALEAATRLATSIGMRPVAIAEADRATYHAAACVASNFLHTLEDFAERLAASAGVARDRLVPLVRASVESWARLGAPAALTGPVARDDEETVVRQRAAVATHAPEDLALFDELVAATRRLASRRNAA